MSDYNPNFRADLDTTRKRLGEGARERDPYEVLGVRPDAPLEVIEASYRALAKTAHPDAGGSEDQMRELNAAIERVRADRKVQA